MVKSGSLMYYQIDANILYDCEQYQIMCITKILTCWHCQNILVAPCIPVNKTDNYVTKYFVFHVIRRFGVFNRFMHEIIYVSKFI